MTKFVEDIVSKKHISKNRDTNRQLERPIDELSGK